MCLLVLYNRPVPAQDGAQSAKEQAGRLLQEGQFARASAIVERELKAGNRDPELWNLEGISQGELQHADLAQRAFEQGLRLAPQSVPLHENLGFLFYRRGKYAEAKTYLKRARAFGSKAPGVLFSLAACQLRTGEAEAAMRSLRDLQPDLENVSEYWDERGRAESGQDPTAAESSFERALALKPDDLVAMNGAATAAEHQGQDEKALSYLIKAKEAAPQDVTTLLHFANVCIRRDLGLDAKAAAQRAYELDSGNTTALYLLARANIALQNWQEARDRFQELSHRVPGFVSAYFALGWLDRKLNRSEDARKEIEQSLRLDPHLTNAQYELSELEREDGNEPRAEALLRSVLHQDPNHVKANAALGDILMRQGKLDEAERLLKRAATDDPASAEAHYKLSILYFREHRNAAAEKEKAAAASLQAEANRSKKTQLRLVLPEGEAVK